MEQLQQQLQQNEEFRPSDVAVVHQVISRVQNVLTASREKLSMKKRVVVPCTEKDFFIFVVSPCWECLEKGAAGSTWKVCFGGKMEPKQKKQFLETIFGEYFLFKELAHCKVFVDLRKDVSIRWYLRKVKATKELDILPKVIETGQMSISFYTSMLPRSEKPWQTTNENSHQRTPL